MADERKYLGAYPTRKDLDDEIFSPIGKEEDVWVAVIDEDEKYSGETTVTYWPSDPIGAIGLLQKTDAGMAIIEEILRRIRRDIFLYEDQYERLVRRGTDSTIKVTDINGNELPDDVVYTDTSYTFYVIEREGDIPMDNTNTEASYNENDDTLEFTNAEYDADEEVIYVEGAYLDEDGFLAFEESVVPSSPDVEFEDDMVNTPYEVENTDEGLFIVVNEVAK